MQGWKAVCVTSFALLQWGNNSSRDGREHEKGAMHKNDNRKN